uniref:Uncharacterized protein n=1 Tax=Rhodnius prolixus TaxID=13249 RepID=T1I207_RHOPR
MPSILIMKVAPAVDTLLVTMTITDTTINSIIDGGEVSPSDNTP